MADKDGRFGTGCRSTVWVSLGCRQWKELALDLDLRAELHHANTFIQRLVDDNVDL